MAKRVAELSKKSEERDQKEQARADALRKIKDKAEKQEQLNAALARASGITE